jgi:hypothetical protein
MNTKILVALVLGITLVGLTGAVSGETTTSDLYYQFVHTVTGDGINIIDAMPVITSGAGWDDGGACSAEKALIMNRLLAAEYAHEGEYEAVLVQSGSASIIKRPLDSEDEFEEFEADMYKAQDLYLSGEFNGTPVDGWQTIKAQFKDYGSVGCNNYSGCGNIHAVGELYDSSRGWLACYGDARISEATIGTASWTSLSADGLLENVIMDGGISAYSSFGDMSVTDGGSVFTAASAYAGHSWNAGSGAPTLPWP